MEEEEGPQVPVGCVLEELEQQEGEENHRLPPWRQQQHPLVGAIPLPPHGEERRDQQTVMRKKTVVAVVVVAED